MFDIPFTFVSIIASYRIQFACHDNVIKLEYKYNLRGAARLYSRLIPLA